MFNRTNLVLIVVLLCLIHINCDKKKKKHINLSKANAFNYDSRCYVDPGFSGKSSSTYTKYYNLPNKWRQFRNRVVIPDIATQTGRQKIGVRYVDNDDFEDQDIEISFNGGSVSVRTTDDSDEKNLIFGSQGRTDYLSDSYVNDWISAISRGSDWIDNTNDYWGDNGIYRFSANLPGSGLLVSGAPVFGSNLGALSNTNIGASVFGQGSNGYGPSVFGTGSIFGQGSSGSGSVFLPGSLSPAGYGYSYSDYYTLTRPVNVNSFLSYIQSVYSLSSSYSSYLDNSVSSTTLYSLSPLTWNSLRGNSISGIFPSVSTNFGYTGLDDFTCSRSINNLNSGIGTVLGLQSGVIVVKDLNSAGNIALRVGNCSLVEATRPDYTPRVGDRIFFRGRPLDNIIQLYDCTISV